MCITGEGRDGGGVLSTDLGCVDHSRIHREDQWEVGPGFSSVEIYLLHIRCLAEPCCFCGSGGPGQFEKYLSY